MISLYIPCHDTQITKTLGTSTTTPIRPLVSKRPSSIAKLLGSKCHPEDFTSPPLPSSSKLKQPKRRKRPQNARRRRKDQDQDHFKENQRDLTNHSSLHSSSFSERIKGRRLSVLNYVKNVSSTIGSGMGTTGITSTDSVIVTPTKRNSINDNYDDDDGEGSDYCEGGHYHSPSNDKGNEYNYPQQQQHGEAVNHQFQFLMDKTAISLLKKILDLTDEDIHDFLYDGINEQKDSTDNDDDCDKDTLDEDDHDRRRRTTITTDTTTTALLPNNVGSKQRSFSIKLRQETIVNIDLDHIRSIHEEYHNTSFSQVNPNASPKQHYNERRKVAKNLKAKLDEALANNVMLEKAIKQDVIRIHKLCQEKAARRLTDPSKKAIQQWAMERMIMISNKNAISYQSMALERWKNYTNLYERRKKRKKFEKYCGILKMCHVMNYICLQRTARCWVTWIHFIDRSIMAEQREKEAKASIIVQTAWRASLVRFRIKNNAATSIQSMMRGTLCRLNMIILRRVCTLQRIARGMMSRSLYRTLVMKKNEQNGANKIQRVWRGRVGRMMFEQMVYEKRAKDGYFFIRCFVRKCLLESKVKEEKRLQAAVILQTNIRIHMCIQRVIKVKKEKQLEKESQEKIAMLGQKRFRGKRARSLYKKMKDTRENATVRIQTNFRGMFRRRQYSKLKVEERSNMIIEARLWRQEWSEVEDRWYYRNMETDEKVWEEPTNSGYTTSTNQLVLQNGDILEPDNSALIAPSSRNENDVVEDEQDCNEEEEEIWKSSGWSKFKDSNNKAYFYNHLTKETSYHRPTLRQ